MTAEKPAEPPRAPLSSVGSRPVVLPQVPQPLDAPNLNARPSLAERLRLTWAHAIPLMVLRLLWVGSRYQVNFP